MAGPRLDSFNWARDGCQLVRVALLLCSIAAAAADKNNNAFRGTSAAAAAAAAADAPAEPTRRADQSQEGGLRARTRCDPQREFHCRLENRCIPLEMRCDFQEQCLDGQDELGCPPESCTFSHNRCFWLNELAWPPAGNRDNETIGTGHSETTQSQRDVLWRRYAPTRDSSPAVARLGSDRNKGQRQVATATVGGLLEQLSGSLGAGEKFIFAPMPSLPWLAERHALAETNKFTSAPIRVDSLPRVASGHERNPQQQQQQQQQPSGQLRQRAKMQTPEIGRTSAMCQLRFEYALWPQRGDGSGPPVIMMDDGSAHIARIETTLRLVAHQQRRRRRRPSDSEGQDDKSEAETKTRTLWSRTVDWSGQPQASNYSADASDEQRSVDWAVGVAELGHLELFALSLEVESLTTTTTTTTATGQVGRVLAAGCSDVVGGGRGQQIGPFVGSLVALKWLKFHACHEWPRQIVQTPNNVALEAVEFMNKNEEEVEQRGAELTDDADEEQLELPERACQPDEFMCPRSGFCLPKERLCNFVNECLSHDDDDDDDDQQQQELAGNNLAELLGLPTTAAGGANQQMVAAHAAEDETLDLCGSILGREHFEAAHEDDKQTQLFLTSRPGRFWHLSGNWTTSRVGLRRNPQHLLHLPQADHTTGSARGTYLSLELPVSATGGDTPGPLYWAAIKSQWMEKLSEREFGECRLKLFYNLVSSFQLGGGGGHGEASSLLASGDDKLKVSLAVEHYTLAGRLLGQLEQTGGNQLPPKLDRKLDALIHTGGVDSRNPRASRVLEYPGVDFWRELNLKLEGLEQGDLFLVRLVIYVELSPRAASRLRRTGERISFNLDDLSTHFGCGPVENEATLERLNRLSERHWLARADGAFNAQDYPTAQQSPMPMQAAQTTHRPESSRRNSLPRIKHKWDYFWPQSPHKAASRWWWRTEDERATVPPPSSSVPGSTRLATTEEQQQQQEDDDDYEERQWRRPLQQIEPQKLVACVLGAFCLIIGLIALIVFVLVPHVERAMMNYQDQIQLSLSGEYSDLPVAHSSSSSSSSSPGTSATTNFNNSPLVSTLGPSPSSAFAIGARRNHRLLVDPFDWNPRPADDGAHSLDMHASDAHSSSSSFSEFSSGDSDGHRDLARTSSADEDFHDASDK